MKRQFVFPTDYDRSDLIAISLPRKLLPILAGKIDEMKHRSCWATESDWQQAIEEIKYVQEQLSP